MRNEIQRILNNTNFRVIIASANPAFAPKMGLLTGPLRVDGVNATYSPIFSTSGDQEAMAKLGQQLQSLYKTLSTAIGRESADSAKILISRAQTVEMYTDSGNPGISFELTFIADSLDTDVHKLATQFYQGVSPATVTNLGIDAPNYYLPETIGTTPKGVWGVQVGKWFKASNLIMTNAAPSISQEVMHNGMPLYATVNLSFKPYVKLSCKEIQEWFISNSNNTASTTRQETV